MDQGNANIALFGIIFLLNVLKIYTYQKIPNKIKQIKNWLNTTMYVIKGQTRVAQSSTPPR